MHHEHHEPELTAEEQRRRSAESPDDEHDAGIRIRGEAPATGRIEPGGEMPNVPPAVVDTPPPGSLQGSPIGIAAAAAGVTPLDADIDRLGKAECGQPIIETDDDDPDRPDADADDEGE